MDGFSADQWEKLTNEQRIAHCLMAAREAETFAEKASPELRQAYKDLAANWNVLATELQAATNRGATNG